MFKFFNVLSVFFAISFFIGCSSNNVVTTETKEGKVGIYYLQPVEGIYDLPQVLIWDGDNLRIGSESKTCSIRHYSFDKEKTLNISLTTVFGDVFSAQAYWITISKSDYEEADSANPFLGLYATGSGTRWVLAIRKSLVTILCIDAYFGNNSTKPIECIATDLGDTLKVDGFGYITYNPIAPFKLTGILYWDKVLSKCLINGLDGCGR